MNTDRIIGTLRELNPMHIMTNSMHDKTPLTPEKESGQNELRKFLSSARSTAERNQALVDYIILMGDVTNWESKGYYICWQLIGSGNYELLEFIIDHSLQNGYKWGIDIRGKNELILGSLLKESLKQRDLKAFGLIFDMEKKSGKGLSVGIKDFADEENLEAKTNRKCVRNILKLALKKGLPITEEDIMFAIEGGCSFTICGMLVESPQAKEILTTDLIAKIRGVKRISTDYGKGIRDILSGLSTNGTVLAAQKSEQGTCRIAKPELNKESFKEILDNKYGIKFERMGDVKVLLRTLIMNNNDCYELLAIIVIHSVQNGCEWGLDLARYKKKPERTLIELAVEYGNFIAFRLLSSLGLLDKIEDTQKILGLAIHSKSGSEKSRKAIYKQMLQSFAGKYAVDKKMIEMIIGSGNEIFFKTLIENNQNVFDRQKLHNLLANTKLIPKNSGARTVIGERLQQLDKAEQKK